MTPALAWADPDPFLEASQPSTPLGRAQRAFRAGQDVQKDFRKAENELAQQTLRRLNTLKTSLQARLLDAAATDFRRATLQQLTADVDRMVVDVTGAIAADARPAFQQAGTLGQASAEHPMAALQLKLATPLTGLDTTLVNAAFDNAVDLLTPPMQGYATQVKTALRQVTLAGDSRQGAINRLRDRIAGDGFTSAAFRAERIIRTEQGRVFNGAAYDRMVVLAQEFPFLRKGWRATKDRRTRKGHQEAGATYARGQGIPIADLFKVNVYDERGKAPKLIGVALLRFPIDPQAKPEGRVAAGATIMCRCNGFVDFDMEQFAAFSRQKVSMALGNVQPPEPEPPAPPKDPGWKQLGDSLKTTLNHYKGVFYTTKEEAARIRDLLLRHGAGDVKVLRAPRGFVVFLEGKLLGPYGFVPKGFVPPTQRTKPAPKPKALTPKALAGKQPATATAVPGAVGPAGPKVSAALNVNPSASYNKVRAALDLLDKVHGDGQLPTIPVGAVAPKYRSGALAYYMHNSMTGVADSMAFGQKILKGTPNMGVFHETGHFLDHQGIGRRFFASETTSWPLGTPPQLTQAMEQLKQALRNSQAIQTLGKWRTANIPGSGYTAGDGVVPPTTRPIHRKTVNYLLQSKETFARAYAQYVAVKSGNAAALAELRNMQASSATGVAPVPATARQGPGTQAGLAPQPGTWDYPWQWSDADFAPIEAAFDRLFEVLGWREKK